VQEAALTAMASVADTAQAQFERYYDTVMPFLLHIVGTANDPILYKQCCELAPGRAYIRYARQKARNGRLTEGGCRLN
jgi:hypothetical protein